MVDYNQVSIYAFAFQKPGVPFNASDSYKWSFNKVSTARVDLKDYPEGNEMLGAEVYFSGRIYPSEDIKCFAKFYDDETNQLLWSGQVNVPNPTTEGHEYWNWYRINFWIGHAQWEIYKPMTVRIEIDVNLSGNTTKRNVLYTSVIDSSATLPESPEEIKSKKRITVEFRDLSEFGLIHLVAPGVGYIGGGVQKLLEKQGEIKEKVQIELPAGWKCTQVTVESGKYLHIDLEEWGSPALAITTGLVIVAIVAAVLVLLGLLAVGWKITDTVAKKIEYDKVRTKADMTKALIELGIDPEVVGTLLEGVDPTPDPGSTEGILGEFKDILIMGVGAVIIIMLIQQMGRTAA